MYFLKTNFEYLNLDICISYDILYASIVIYIIIIYIYNYIIICAYYIFPIWDGSRLQMLGMAADSPKH